MFLAAFPEAKLGARKLLKAIEQKRVGRGDCIQRRSKFSTPAEREQVRSELEGV
jgi:hypothetical protein